MNEEQTIICAECQRALTPLGTIEAWLELRAKELKTANLTFHTARLFETNSIGIRVDYDDLKPDEPLPEDWNTYSLAVSIRLRLLNRLYEEGTWSSVLNFTMLLLQETVTKKPTELITKELEPVRYGDVTVDNDGVSISIGQRLYKSPKPLNVA
jgi:hypothetical protein